MDSKEKKDSSVVILVKPITILLLCVIGASLLIIGGMLGDWVGTFLGGGAILAGASRTL